MLNDNTTNGYVIFDLLGVDLTIASQNITGIYKRVKDVFEADKPIIMAVDNIPPFAVTAKKVSNYYELVSEFYVFDINTNDILIIRPNSGTFTEVTITPSLLSGTKIADYSVGETSGSLYAPTQQTEINDSTASDHTTYSSDKINTLLSGKVDTGTVAVIDDLIPSTTTVFSSQKVIDGLTAYYDLTSDDIKNIVSLGFSTESSYSVGDYCIYGHKLYRFTSAKSAGAWDSTKVTLVNVGSELKVKQDSDVLNIESSFAANTSIVNAVSSLITQYGTRTMIFSFVITGYGWVSGMMSFHGGTQGGGYAIANNKGKGGNKPALYSLQYVNGTVTMGYPWEDPNS